MVLAYMYVILAIGHQRTSKLRQRHVERCELAVLSCEYVGDYSVAQLPLAHVAVNSNPNMRPKADSIIDDLPKSLCTSARGVASSMTTLAIDLSRTVAHLRVNE